MKYHNITKEDMLNGDGLRVVLWVAGCSHHCEGCHNPITWNPDYGAEFDDATKNEIFTELNKPWTSGITFSGGDPMHEANIDTILTFAKELKERYQEKTIWVYSGYRLLDLVNVSEERKEEMFENITFSNEDLLSVKTDDKNHEKRVELLKLADVFCDGRFDISLKDMSYPWVGSTNQCVWRKI